MVTGRKEVKNLVLVISCIEGYKQLTEYYKTKTKTAVHQCFVVCFYGLRAGICSQKFVCLNSVQPMILPDILGIGYRYRSL